MQPGSHFHPDHGYLPEGGPGASLPPYGARPPMDYPQGLAHPATHGVHAGPGYDPHAGPAHVPDYDPYAGYPPSGPYAAYPPPTHDPYAAYPPADHDPYASYAPPVHDPHAAYAPRRGYDPYAGYMPGPAPEPEYEPVSRTGNEWGPRLSALLVNGDGGDFALSCVRSLRREWTASGYPAERLEVIVVQNACAADQRPWLEALAQEGSLVLETGAPLSHAAAIQLALEYSTGDEDDLVAVLSPFLIFLPGSVGRMVEYMASHPDCGLLGPRCYFDEGKVFQHPSLALPSAATETKALLSAMSPVAGRFVARGRSEENSEWWTVREPLETDMLSPGCLFVSRSVILEEGQLFDASFPFGFEDADLCRRAKAGGRWIVYLPKAEVVLHGLAAEAAGDQTDLRRRYEASRTAYFGRYLGGTPKHVVEWLERRVDGRRVDPRAVAIHALHELGGHMHPFELELPPPGDWMIELSSSPQWAHSIGAFARAGHWQFPHKPWARLERGTHYLRVVEFGTRHVAAAYRFEKLAEPRRLPIAIAPPGSFLPSVRQHWPDEDRQAV